MKMKKIVQRGGGGSDRVSSAQPKLANESDLVKNCRVSNVYIK